MKKTLAVSLVLFTAGALSQAPVVDVNQQQTSQSASSSSGTDLFSLEQRIEVLERIVNSRSDTQQRMQQQIDLLQDDVDSLRGSIELHTHQLEKVLERQRELYLRIENSVANLQQQSQQVANDISPSTTANSTASSAANGDVQAAYQSAVDLILQQKDYDAAVPAFESFLAQYPDSRFTDNAHYWLGQLLYNKQEYARAKVQFQQVVDKFASSSKRADSLLKLGMIAKQAGDNASANSLFQKVVTEYPGSTPARLAQQQL